MWTNKRFTWARRRSRASATHSWCPPNTIASLRFRGMSDNPASGLCGALLTSARGCLPCVPVSRLRLASRAMSSNTEQGLLRSTTRWARHPSVTASIRCTERRVQEGRFRSVISSVGPFAAAESWSFWGVSHRGYDLTRPESPNETPTCRARVWRQYHGVPLSAPPRFQIHHQVTEEGQFETHRAPQRCGVPTTRPKRLVSYRTNREHITTAQRETKVHTENFHSGFSHVFPLQQSTQPTVKLPQSGRRCCGDMLATIEQVSQCSLHVHPQARLMGAQNPTHRSRFAVIYAPSVYGGDPERLNQGCRRRCIPKLAV